MGWGGESLQASAGTDKVLSEGFLAGTRQQFLGSFPVQDVSLLTCPENAAEPSWVGSRAYGPAFAELQAYHPWAATGAEKRLVSHLCWLVRKKQPDDPRGYLAPQWQPK